MENGRMDSNSKLTSSDTSNYITDLGGKSVRSCFANDTTLTFRNGNNNTASSVDEISAVVNNFVDCKCNGKPSFGPGDVSKVVSEGAICSDCDNNALADTRKTNSSQYDLTIAENSLCSNLEDRVSSLSINEAAAEFLHELTRSQSTSCNDESDKNCLVTNQLSEEFSRNAELSCHSEPKADNVCDDANTWRAEPEERDENGTEIIYISYESENQMPDIMKLIQKDLSEPYSIYTYRYFIHNWPHLCFLAVCNGKSVGAIVCKLDLHRKIIKRGYIAMLAVDECYRKQGIGSNLVLKAIRVMVAEGADEVVLETEITNQPALRLYENLGFVRDKRLFRYYLNGVDALRLKLWLR